MDHNPYKLKTLDEKPSGYLDAHQFINFLAKNKIPIKRMDNLPRFADQNNIEMKKLKGLALLDPRPQYLRYQIPHKY